MKTKFILSCSLVVLLSYWALSLYAIQAIHQATSFWFVPIWGTHILWFTSLGDTEILSLPSIWGTHISVIFAIAPIAFFLLMIWIGDSKIIHSCILVALLAYWTYSMYVIQATHQSTPFWPTPFPFGDRLFGGKHISIVYIIATVTCLLFSLLLTDALGDMLTNARSKRRWREQEGQVTGQERPRTRRKIVEGASDPHYLDEKQVEAEYNADLPIMVLRATDHERSSAANASVDLKFLTTSGNIQDKTTESAQAREVRLQEMLNRHVNFALDEKRVICISEKSFADEVASLPSLTELSKGDFSALTMALSKGDFSVLTALSKSNYSILLTALSKGDHSPLTALSKGDYSVISKMVQDPVQLYIKAECETLDQVKENTPTLIAGNFSVQRKGDLYVYQLEHPVNRYLLNGEKHYKFMVSAPCDEIAKRYKYHYEELLKNGVDSIKAVTIYGTMVPILDKYEHIKYIEVIPTAIW
jgi:hypothetical protein